MNSDGFTDFLQKHCPGLLRQIEDTGPLGQGQDPAPAHQNVFGIAPCYLCGTPVLAGVGAVNLCINCYIKQIAQERAPSEARAWRLEKRQIILAWIATGSILAGALLWLLLR